MTRPRTTIKQRAAMLVHRYRSWVAAFRKRRGMESSEAHRQALRAMGVHADALEWARRESGKTN